MTNPALQSALSATANQRQQRVEAIAISTQAQDNLVLTMVGYQNGSVIGRLPNGGRVPVSPLSNGSLEVGNAFIALGTGSSLYGNWMPQ